MNNKPSLPNEIVAYFDFDGTITKSDTFLPFLLYISGWGKFIIKSPKLLLILGLYIFKMYTNEEAKEKVWAILTRGKSFAELDQKSQEFVLHKLGGFIKPEIYARLEYHLEHQHYVILVSANFALYLSYWVKQHKIYDVIATEVEFINQVSTGRLLTRNCYALQKVERIKQYLKDKNMQFSYSFGYGNSRGDYELLNFVDEGYLVNDAKIISWVKLNDKCS